MVTPQVKYDRFDCPHLPSASATMFSSLGLCQADIIN